MESSSKYILVAEAEENLRTLYKSIFEQAGHKVTLVGDALSAMYAIRDQIFEVVWTDLYMKETKKAPGQKVIGHKVACYARTKGIQKIVIFTGNPHALNELEEKPNLDGIIVLEKPSDPEEMLRIINAN